MIPIAPALEQEMAAEGTTAQVHPQKLTAAFMEAAQAKGAKLVRGTVQGITLDRDNNSVAGSLASPSPAEASNTLPGPGINITCATCTPCTARMILNVVAIVEPG